MSEFEPGSPEWELDICRKDWRIASDRYDRLDREREAARQERDRAARALNQAWEAVHG